MPWQVIARSEIGTKHALLRDKRCQDYVRWTDLLDRKIIIGVVSDGAGSAKYSWRGSECTVNISIEELKKQSWHTVPSQVQAEETFHNLVKRIREELYRLAKDEGCSFQDFACTLLVFVAAPSWLVAMQIGDGFIVVREANSKEYRLLFVPDKGEYINETTFVTSPDIADRIRIIANSIYPEFICAATDGIENISLIKTENWRPSPGFFEPLRNHIQSSKSSKLKECELSKFLNSERLNKVTDDDKTLILCSYGETSKPPKETNQLVTYSETNYQNNLRRDTIKIEDFSLAIDIVHDVSTSSKRCFFFSIKGLLTGFALILLLGGAGLLFMSRSLPIQLSQSPINLLPPRNPQTSPDDPQADPAQTLRRPCSLIDLKPDKPISLSSANLSPNASCYKFKGGKNQQLELSLTSNGLLLELKDSNDKSFFTITQNRENKLSFQMSLNKNNEYYMFLSPKSNEFKYVLEIKLSSRLQK